jgi:hypothetical protein
VSEEPLPQSAKRDVGHKISNEPPADIAFYPVDREEVDRLRKRFMKLDKVRLSPPKEKIDSKQPNRRTSQLTNPRTAPVQSSAKNSCNCPKSPPTRWQHA